MLREWPLALCLSGLFVAFSRILHTCFMPQTNTLPQPDLGTECDAKEPESQIVNFKKQMKGLAYCGLS